MKNPWASKVGSVMAQNHPPNAQKATTPEFYILSRFRRSRGQYFELFSSVAKLALLIEDLSWMLRVQGLGLGCRILGFRV